MTLAARQIARYSRQLVLKNWSAKAQEKLLASSALIVGAGGLGSPVAYYLTAAGIGKLTIVDYDSVEESNLNRQILHSTVDIGRPKAESAKEKLEALNPDCRVTALVGRIDASNAHVLFESADVVLDCTDGFGNKYLLNDAAVLFGKPLIHAGVLGFAGQAMTVLPKKTACLRCVFPTPPDADSAPTCAQAGVMGAAVGTIASIQAMEAIKLLAGIGQPLTNRMMTFDSLSMRWQEIKLKRNPKCPMCGRGSKIKKLAEEPSHCDSRARR